MMGIGAALTFAATAQDATNRGRKFKLTPPTVRVEVLVVRAKSGKPIENASVIFHEMEGTRQTGNMQLKTNEDGKAVIDVLQLGSTVRFQVVAHGFQTYGEDLKLDKPNMMLNVVLSRPVEQYSAYKDHTADSQPATAAKPAPDAVPAFIPAPTAADPATAPAAK